MKWLRRLLLTIALLVAALIAAALLLPRLVDSETLRSMLIIAARTHTGRELTVEGEVRFALLPRPAVVLPRLRLANAEGFGAEPFASLDGARANLRLWPLLWGRLQVSSVRIERPQLRLMVDARGRSNWADLLPQPRPASQARVPSTSDSVMAGLAGRVGIGQLTLREADILWSDQASGRWARLHDLDIALGALDPGGPLPLSASGVLDTGDPQRSAQLDLTATAQRAANGTWRAADLRLEAVLGGAPLREALTLRLSADAGFDPAQARLRLRRLTLEGDPVQLRGDLTLARGDDAAPVLGAQLRLERLDARALATLLGHTLTTADPQALTRIEGDLDIGANTSEINLARIDLAVDDSHWRGTARVSDFSDPALRFALEVDRLDLDRYLPGEPAPAQHAQAAGTEPAPVAPVGSPAEALRRLARLDLDGTFNLAILTVRGLSLERVALRARSGDGQMTLQPVSASLYGGTAEASAHVEARRGEPALRLKLAATDVAAGPLLVALTGKDTVQGRIALGGELTGVAAAGDALLRSLNGTARLSGSDGVLKGINADRSICQARAVIARTGGKDAEECDPSPDTRFSTARMSGPIAAGVWRNDELTVEQVRFRPGRFYRITGTGTLDLAGGEIDYRLKAASVRRGADGAAEDDVREAPVPLRVRGRAGAFKVEPELKDALRDEAVRRLQEKLGPKPDGERESSGKTMLRGLFGR
jgi:AsmA protein